MDAKVLKDIDKLEKDKEGYYDFELDRFFTDLTEWLKEKHNKTWAQVL